MLSSPKLIEQSCQIALYFSIALLNHTVIHCLLFPKLTEQYYHNSLCAKQYCHTTLFPENSVSPLSTEQGCGVSLSVQVLNTITPLSVPGSSNTPLPALNYTVTSPSVYSPNFPLKKNSLHWKNKTQKTNHPTTTFPCPPAICQWLWGASSIADRNDGVQCFEIEVRLTDDLDGDRVCR